MARDLGRGTGLEVRLGVPPRMTLGSPRSAPGPMLFGLLLFACNGEGPRDTVDPARTAAPVIPGKPQLPPGLKTGPSAAPAPSAAPTVASRPLSEFPKALEEHKGAW